MVTILLLTILCPVSFLLGKRLGNKALYRDFKTLTDYHFKLLESLVTFLPLEKRQQISKIIADQYAQR